MIKQIFKILKNSKEFIPINILSNKLKISEEDILFSISSLKNMGYNIIENENSAYLLDSKYKDKFNNIEIDFYLNTKFIGKELKFFETIDSTNVFAKNFAKNNFNIEGTAIVTNSQTNGKGRFGRTWVNEKDTNIAVSLILSHKFSILETTIFNLIVAIAVCRGLEKSIGILPNLKWPNDIILKNKKIGGILTEVITKEDKGKYIIVGIGINVNNEKLPDKLLNKATSLKIELGKTFNRSIILVNILYEIEKVYYEYSQKLSFEPFINEYRNLCLNIGKKVKVEINNKTIYGKILDINNKGELILISDFNEKIYLTSGEISLRGIRGEYI